MTENFKKFLQESKDLEEKARKSPPYGGSDFDYYSCHTFHSHKKLCDALKIAIKVLDEICYGHDCVFCEAKEEIDNIFKE